MKKKSEPFAGLPRQVRVGPHDIKLTPMPAHWGMNTDGALTVFGDYSDQASEIRLNVDGSATQVVDTVLHEIMHAICRTYHITREDDEENTVRKMATGMTQVLRDSPQLRKWITKNLAE